ncbi:ankyrin repeat domain-containing protein, partial [Sulfurimonas sp.]|nr:ankyrin repeat domain-containing protein [Sulfurimonas sp.]
VRLELVYIDKKLAKDVLSYIAFDLMLDGDYLMYAKTFFKELDDINLARKALRIAWENEKKDPYLGANGANTWLELAKIFADESLLNDIDTAKEVIKDALALDSKWYVSEYLAFAAFIYTKFKDELYSKEVLKTQLKNFQLKIADESFIYEDLLYDYGEIINKILELFNDQALAQEALNIITHDKKVSLPITKLLDSLEEGEFINWADTQRKYMMELPNGVNHINSTGNSLFMLAIRKEHQDCFDLIQSRNPDVNIKNKSKKTALYYAIKHNDIDAVKYIMTQNPEILDGYINSLEHVDLELANFLLDYDVNLAEVDVDEFHDITYVRTALDIAVERYVKGDKRYIEIIKKMITKDALLSSDTLYKSKESRSNIDIYKAKDSLKVLTTDENFSTMLDLIQTQYSSTLEESKVYETNSENTTTEQEVSRDKEDLDAVYGASTPLKDEKEASDTKEEIEEEMSFKEILKPLIVLLLICLGSLYLFSFATTGDGFIYNALGVIGAFVSIISAASIVMVVNVKYNFF